MYDKQDLKLCNQLLVVFFFVFFSFKFLFLIEEQIVFINGRTLAAGQSLDHLRKGKKFQSASHHIHKSLK